MAAPSTTRAERPARRRPVLALLGLVALLVLLVGLSVGRTRPEPEGPPQDAEVSVTDVAFAPSGTSYTVTSVQARTHGDEGFLRLRLVWFDEPDSSGLRHIPAFSAEVLHGAPYAGITTDCGLPTARDVPARSAPDTVELPCSGLLVPAAVDSVALRD